MDENVIPKSKLSTESSMAYYVQKDSEAVCEYSGREGSDGLMMPV